MKVKLIIDLTGGARTEIEVENRDEAEKILEKMKDMSKPMIVYGAHGSTLLNPRHVVRTYFVMPGSIAP